MGRTGDKIKELELRISNLESLTTHWKHKLERLKDAFDLSKPFKIPEARRSGMQSFIEYIIATIPPEKLEEIFNPPSTAVDE